MCEQRSWQERYGVADLEAGHWIGIGGMAFIVLSPFFALVREAAGALALIVGLMMFMASAHMTPDDDGETNDNERVDKEPS